LDLTRVESLGRAAVSYSASYLTDLGFVVGHDHLSASPGGGHGVLTVPLELLRPPRVSGGAIGPAWDVTELAASLMAKYGGPGSGLLFANLSDAGGGGDGDSGVDAAATAAMAAAMAATGGGGGARPRVLVLPAVPRLSDQRGPRHEMFVQQLQSGPDRSFMSCDWMLTGKPYRRRRGALRRRRSARRTVLVAESDGGDEAGGLGSLPLSLTAGEWVEAVEAAAREDVAGTAAGEWGMAVGGEDRR
jgi:hypothetical protein